MSLFAKDPQKILKEAEDFMVNNTPVNSTGPGSKFYGIIQIFAKHLSEAYDTFDVNIAIGLVYGAKGKYLDYLGDLFGVQRLQPNTATVDSNSQVIRFYTNSSDFGTVKSNMTVLAGTKVWAIRNDTKIEYILTEDLPLPDAANEAFASVSANQHGLDGNTQPGSIIYTDFNVAGVLVENTSSIENGRDPENDDNYRYRIINQKLVSASANNMALRVSALTIPGVADVEIFDKHFGSGTTAVLVKSTTPVVSQLLLARVQSELDKVKASGTTCIAIAPKYLSMTFAVSISFKEATSAHEKDSAHKAVISVITDYVNNLDIGEQFIVNTAANLVINAHEKIKTIGSPNKFFNNIYVQRDTIRLEVIADYTPSEFQKLIMSTNTNSVVFT